MIFPAIICQEDAIWIVDESWKNRIIISEKTGILATKHNLKRNTLKWIIDSKGTHYNLEYSGNNKTLIRSILSNLLVNIIVDYYRIRSNSQITVGDFISLIESKIKDIHNADSQELIKILISDLSAIENKQLLQQHITKLNL